MEMRVVSGNRCWALDWGACWDGYPLHMGASAHLGRLNSLRFAYRDVEATGGIRKAEIVMVKAMHG